MAEGNGWQVVPLGLPLKDNYSQQVHGSWGGGAVTALDVDLSTSEGSVIARETDAHVYPPSTHSVIHEIAQNIDSNTGQTVTAVLAGDTATANAPLKSFAVRGMRDLYGSEVNGENWFEPHGSQPANAGGWERAVLEHGGREVRVHAENPSYYGLPQAITKVQRDLPFANEDNTGDIQRSEWWITGPISERNEIRAPRDGELTLDLGAESDGFVRSGIGNGIAQTSAGGHPMWGSMSTNLGDLSGRHEFAYFAATYLYDGFQESTLYVFPNVGMYSYVGQEGTTEGSTLRIRATLTVNNVNEDFPSVFTIPRRVRKIRLHCAPSERVVTDPRRQLQFRLVNEIDVAEGDKESLYHPYQGAATRWVNPGNELGEGTWLRFMVDYSLVDVSSGNNDRVNRFPDFAPLAGEEFTQYARSTRLKIADYPNSPTYYVQDAMGQWTRSGYAVWLWLKVTGSATDMATLATLFPVTGASGTSRGVEVFHQWALGVNSRSHKNTVGEEILLRNSYEDLSGLPQTLTESVSPPRRGGCMIAGRAFIWDVTDKDGMRHKNRLMWCDSTPSGLLAPDRFSPDQYKDFDFPIEAVIGGGSQLVVFGKDRMVTGTIGETDLQWRFSDTFNVGCVARKSIAQTPVGTLFLSTDGVRVLTPTFLAVTNGDAFINTLSPKGVLSRDISRSLSALRAQYSEAVAAYSPERGFYLLIFPQQSTAFVYDFLLPGWVNAFIEKPCYAACADVDGNILFSQVDITRSGIYRYRGGATMSERAVYAVKLVAGDRVHHRQLAQFQPYYLAGDSQTFRVTIAKEDEDPDVFADTVASGNASTNFNSEARSHTYTFSGFQQLYGVLERATITDRITRAPMR